MEPIPILHGVGRLEGNVENPFRRLDQKELESPVEIESRHLFLPRPLGTRAVLKQDSTLLRDIPNSAHTTSEFPRKFPPMSPGPLNQVHPFTEKNFSVSLPSVSHPKNPPLGNNSSIDTDATAEATDVASTISSIRQDLLNTSYSYLESLDITQEVPSTLLNQSSNSLLQFKDVHNPATSRTPSTANVHPAVSGSYTPSPLTDESSVRGNGGLPTQTSYLAVSASFSRYSPNLSDAMDTIPLFSFRSASSRFSPSTAISRLDTPAFHGIWDIPLSQFPWSNTSRFATPNKYHFHENSTAGSSQDNVFKSDQSLFPGNDKPTSPKEFAHTMCIHDQSPDSVSSRASILASNTIASTTLSVPIREGNTPNIIIPNEDSKLSQDTNTNIARVGSLIDIYIQSAKRGSESLGSSDHLRPSFHNGTAFGHVHVPATIEGPQSLVIPHLTTRRVQTGDASTFTDASAESTAAQLVDLNEKAHSIATNIYGQSTVDQTPTSMDMDRSVRIEIAVTASQNSTATAQNVAEEHCNHLATTSSDRMVEKESESIEQTIKDSPSVSITHDDSPIVIGETSHSAPLSSRSLYISDSFTADSPQSVHIAIPFPAAATVNSTDSVEVHDEVPTLLVLEPKRTEEMPPRDVKGDSDISNLESIIQFDNYLASTCKKETDIIQSDPARESIQDKTEKTKVPGGNSLALTPEKQMPLFTSPANDHQTGRAGKPISEDSIAKVSTHNSLPIQTKQIFCDDVAGTASAFRKDQLDNSQGSTLYQSASISHCPVSPTIRHSNARCQQERLVRAQKFATLEGNNIPLNSELHYDELTYPKNTSLPPSLPISHWHQDSELAQYDVSQLSLQPSPHHASSPISYSPPDSLSQKEFVTHSPSDSLSIPEILEQMPIDLLRLERIRQDPDLLLLCTGLVAATAALVTRIHNKSQESSNLSLPDADTSEEVSEAASNLPPLHHLGDGGQGNNVAYSQPTVKSATMNISSHESPAGKHTPNASVDSSNKYQTPVKTRGKVPRTTSNPISQRTPTDRKHRALATPDDSHIPRSGQSGTSITEPFEFTSPSPPRIPPSSSSSASSSSLLHPYSAERLTRLARIYSLQRRNKASPLKMETPTQKNRDAAPVLSSASSRTPSKVVDLRYGISMASGRPKPSRQLFPHISPILAPETPQTASPSTPSSRN